MKLHVGTSGFSYPAWKGSFYPARMPQRQMLGFYGRHFQTVEINGTFFRMPEADGLQEWASQVPAGFKFILKAPKRITHIKRLKDCGETVTHLFEVAAVLQKRLGPIFFQLPPNLKKDLPRLGDFLDLLPARRQVAFEFRHQSWFDDEVIALLGKRKVALGIAETENDLEVPFVATANWGYLRLRQPDYTDAELKAWIDRIRAQDWQDVFVFFRHEDEGRGPRLAKRFLELFETK